jgi:hypothetical protein
MPTNLVTGFVLSAQLVLPAFNQFAERAGLDVTLPLEEKRITKSYVGRKNNSAMVTVDNRHHFVWHALENNTERGRIYYQDLKWRGADRKLKLRQLVNQTALISTNDVRRIAEQCLTNLGVNFDKLEAGLPMVGQHTYQHTPEDAVLPVPFFGVRWFPKGIDKPQWHDLLVEVEISGLNRKITYFNASPAAGAALTFDLHPFDGKKSRGAIAP